MKLDHDCDPPITPPFPPPPHVRMVVRRWRCAWCGKRWRITTMVTTCGPGGRRWAGGMADPRSKSSRRWQRDARHGLGRPRPPMPPPGSPPNPGVPTR